jgi:proteasome lid subunit RPN8/RPN11
MTDLGTDSTDTTWSTPQCPFTIEYSSRVLDDIRLAVVDAFFSLPRGGAEIGGILLGTHEAGRVVISDYLALDCEHATGPSFTLSGNDEAQLTKLLASSRGKVAGWYHSHTRSEIFLSEADLDLHQRFFPEPWQVALVLKPHTFETMRMGFFFRELDGSIHGSGAYQEIVLEALPMRPMPSGRIPPQSSQPSPFRRASDSKSAVRDIIDVVLPKVVLPKEEPGVLSPAGKETQAPPLPQPIRRPLADARGSVLDGAKPAEPSPELPAPSPDVPPPAFLTGQPKPPKRRWRAALAIGVVLAAGAAGFQSRALWPPRVIDAVRAFSVGPPPSVGLNTLDTDGQLQIRWNRNSPPAQSGVDGILEITDGPQPQAIQMDRPHLQAGVFTYARQSDRVEVKLIVHLPHGPDVRDVTTFLGKLPERKPAPEDPEIRKQRDELAREAAKLKSDLEAQAVRTRKLEKSLTTVQKTLLEQQLQRLRNQAPPKD